MIPHTRTRKDDGDDPTRLNAHTRLRAALLRATLKVRKRDSLHAQGDSGSEASASGEDARASEAPSLDPSLRPQGDRLDL